MKFSLVFAIVGITLTTAKVLDLDLEGQDGGDGGSAAAAAAGTPLSKSTPRPIQPRKIPVKIIDSSTSGDYKLPPVDVEEGWVLRLPQPSKTRFRPAKRSGTGTGTGHFSYLKPRKTDFAETVA